MAARQKLVTLVHCFTVDADDAEREVEAVLSGSLNWYDFPNATTDVQVEDVSDQANADNVVHAYFGGRKVTTTPVPGPDPDAA